MVTSGANLLKKRRKLSHLVLKGPNSSDPKFHIWDEEDSTIMSWLWNSMVLEISGTCMMCSEDAALLKRFVEKERIFEFLASLNVEYDHKRSQVLGGINRSIMVSNGIRQCFPMVDQIRFPTMGMARQICPKQTTKIFTGVITVKKLGHEKNRNSKGEQQRSGLRQDDWTCKRKGWVGIVHESSCLNTPLQNGVLNGRMVIC
ncbi:hypothetical protein AAG906_014274 [Vitis piasezkii]